MQSPGRRLQPECIKRARNEALHHVHFALRSIGSTLIIEYLDEVFPTPSMMPADPYARAIARQRMNIAVLQSASVSI